MISNHKPTNLKNFKFKYVPSKNVFSSGGLKLVRAYLGKVQKGQPNVYTAPFAKGSSMSEILEHWKQILVSIEPKWPTLWEFEMGLADKVGPMSVQLPLADRMNDIISYYEDTSLSSKPISFSAIREVLDEFQAVKGLRLRSQVRTLTDMKKSSNSGCPYFTRRRNVLRETVPFEIYIDNRHGIKTKQYLEDAQRSWECAAVIGWRGQEGGSDYSDVKQRVVWMFPFAVNIAELSVYQPLVEACQAHHLVPAWVSNDEVDRRITDLFDTKSENDLIVCTDFTKFDQHFRICMQDAARSILEGLLTLDVPAKRWIDQIFPIKYNIPLVIGFDREQDTICLLKGEHGMASGSGGTNADETLAHRALQYEAAITNGSTLNRSSMCLGDDGILSYPGITVEQVIEVYQSHGLECNASKQYASTQDCTYLRRWHHNDYRIDGVCVGVYSTCRALGRLRYLERFMDPAVWSPKLVALRQLSIIENCKWHPLFQQFVDFCMERDKYRLGIDIPGFLTDIVQIAQEATDYMPDFLGYTKTLQGEGPEGIEGWRVVKYLKSKA